MWREHAPFLRPVQKSAWSRRCSKLALGKYEIQSKCKYRSARIPEGRAREKGNNGKVRSRAVLRRVRIFLHTFFPLFPFFLFELRIDRKERWSSKRISERKFFYGVEINGWMRVDTREGNKSIFFSHFPSPPFPPGRFLENGKTELMATDLRGFFVDPGAKLLNSIGGGSPGRFIVASKRITNVDADETARK